MKLYAPRYYEDFKCIADKCTHSCCIGWEIDVDKTTYARYKKSNNEYAKTVLESIEDCEALYFKLTDEERCPHLNQQGLCNIIINMGEDFLCDICRAHPRFYNFTNYGQEAGIGMSCPEACRIILNSDDYDEFDVIARGTGDLEIIDYDALEDRDKIYAILKNKSIGLESKLREICQSYEIDLKNVDNEAYLECINSLEYLDNSHRPLFSAFLTEPRVSKDNEKYLERALAYFIYRHCTEALSIEDFKISLLFCLFCENLLASLIENKKEGEVYEIARILSEEIEYNTDNIDKIKELFY